MVNDNPSSVFQQVNGEGEGSILQDIHDQMSRGEDINVEDAVFKYNTAFPGEGALRLLQDLQKMRFAYYNLIEEVKNIGADRFISVPSGQAAEEDAANAIRSKYIALGMVPEDYLPHTKPWELLKSSFQALRKLYNAEISILSAYSGELARAMRLAPGTTLSFQIGLLPAGLTIGWERAAH